LKEVRKLKEIHYEFPEGVLCSTDHHGNQKDGLLNKNFRMMEVLVSGTRGNSDQELEWVKQVFFKLTVESEARLLEAKTATKKKNFREEARERMSSMKIGPA
jgi:hypothetical protein